MPRELSPESALRIQSLRSQLGMSTAEFGEAAGVSRRTVENWEQGRVPSSLALRLIAQLETRKRRAKTLIE